MLRTTRYERQTDRMRSIKIHSKQTNIKSPILRNFSIQADPLLIFLKCVHRAMADLNIKALPQPNERTRVRFHGNNIKVCVLTMRTYCSYYNYGLPIDK